MSKEKELVGTWKLISFSLYLAGDTTYSRPVYLPLGDSPLGRITFTPSGYMSCLLTRSDVLEAMTSPSWIQASEDEIITIARPMVTYCGPFRLHQQDGVKLFSTAVDIALDPTWIGKPQTRKWEIKRTNRTTQLILKPVQEFTLPVSYLTMITCKENYPNIVIIGWYKDYRKFGLGKA
jgi:hypothetical protein